MSKYDSEIQNRLNVLPRNATLMSPEIQNKMLECAARLLLWRIKYEGHSAPSTYFAILADEYKDQSKRELIAVCIRYILAGMI